MVRLVFVCGDILTQVIDQINSGVFLSKIVNHISSFAERPNNSDQ